MNSAMRNKLVFFISFLAMIGILVSVAYMAFLRKVNVDVMNGIEIVYTGENGNATVEVVNSGININQRHQEFFDTVTYEVEPSSNLKNGDVIHIKASYDQEVADRYNFEPVNTEQDVRVEGLVDQYASLEDIDPDYVEEIFKEADRYVEDREEEIFQIEVDDQADNTRVVDSQTVYQAFLKSKTLSTDDRMVEVKQQTYQYNDQTYVLYYVVVVPQINQSNTVQTQDIYGEKANLTPEETEGRLFAQYIERVYQERFTVQEIVPEQPLEQEETEDE